MANKKLKRVDEKVVLFLVFAVLAILALGSLFFIKPKITGFVVIEEYENQTACENAGYAWEETTENVCTPIDGCEIGVTGCVDTCEECEDVVVGECSDLNYETQVNCEFNNETWEETTENVCTPIDGCEIGVTGCVDTCEECEDVVTGGECVGDVCDSSHLNLCLDEPTCTGAGGYWYEGVCNAQEQCIPDCSDKECGSDGCGGSCGECDEDESCVDGECEKEGETNTTETPPETTPEEGITGEVITPVCTPNWECGAWSECVEGTQTRSCTDVNSCGTGEGKPAESQSCTPPETCSDGIKNQDEKGVDCGGVCEKRCSIFTIVGSAINVPLNTSKEFILNHKVVSFSVLGVIVLALSWVVAVKVFLKKKSLLFFLRKKESSA